MANRFWVGGTANWDATAGTKWATTSGGAGGAAVPTAADDVFFSALSTGTCSIPAATTVVCRSIDCSGFTNTLKFNATTSTLSVGDASGGIVKFVSGMTLTLTAVGTINFLGSTSSTTYQLTSAGKTLPNLTINSGASTTIQFADNVTSSGIIALTAGILDMNGKTISCLAFSSTNSNTRTLTMGAAAITCTQAGASAWNGSTVTGLTVTANTASVTCSGAAATITSGAINWNGLSFAMTGAGAPIVFAAGAFTVAGFTRVGTAAKTDVLILTGSFTVTTSLILSGNSATNRLIIQSDATTRTITCNGSILAQNVDFMDIAGAGSASWNLSAITGNSGDCGGNSGITFTSSSTQTATGTSSFTWSTHGWTTRVPLPQDDVVVSNSFSASQTITADMPRLGRSIDMSGCTGSPILSTPTSIDIFGSLILASGVTPSGTTTLTLRGRSSYSVTSAGQTFTQPVSITAPGGTYTFTDAFSSNFDGSFFGAFCVNILLGTGTLNVNSNVSITGATSGVTASSGVLNMGTGTWSLATTSTVPFWHVTSGTVNGSSSTIALTSTTSSTRTFNGGNQSYGTLSYTLAGSTGQLTISGSNTFDKINFSDASNARTLSFTSGTTNTITSAFNVNGTSGKLMSIISTSAASAATLTKSGGVVSCDYLSIQDSAATGGASWFAGANSTSVSGNSGWIFNNTPSGFLDFF